MKEELKVSQCSGNTMKSKKTTNIVFYFSRSGIYGDDAMDASKILGTSTNSFNKNCSPMIAVPVCAAGKYIDQLVRDGRKVAVYCQIGVASPLVKRFERKVIRFFPHGETLAQRMARSASNTVLGSIATSISDRLNKFKDLKAKRETVTEQGLITPKGVTRLAGYLAVEVMA